MPARKAHIRRIRHWIANRGVKGFLLEVWYRLRLLLHGKPLPGRAAPENGPHPIDRAYGVDTTGLLWGEELGRPGGGAASHYWATGYYGIGPSAFTAALENMAVDWPRYTFIDVGCGKGRALLLALRFPFRRVLGIELSGGLVSVAQTNLARFRAPWRQPHVPAEAIEADATKFTVPDGPLLLFLYHPFAGPVMKRFLAHVKQAAVTEARDILLLYANPELGAQMEAAGDVVRLWRACFPLSEEDAAADRFGSRDEYFHAYRLQP